MSWPAVQAVIQAGREPGRFTDAEFRVLLNLAEHHNGKTGRCDPSRGLLGDEAAKERTQLRRILRNLEARGEIRRADPSTKGGRGHRQGYRLTIKGGYSAPVSGRERGAGKSTKGGQAQPADQRKHPTTRKEPGKAPSGGAFPGGESAEPAPSHGSGSAEPGQQEQASEVAGGPEWKRDLAKFYAQQRQAKVRRALANHGRPA